MHISRLLCEFENQVMRQVSGKSDEIDGTRLENVRGVNSAKVQDFSFGEGAVVICLGVVHMEEEVPDRVQVEVEREEQGTGETHGKEQSEEQRENKRSINRSSWRWGDAHKHVLEP